MNLLVESYIKLNNSDIITIFEDSLDVLERISDVQSEFSVPYTASFDMISTAYNTTGSEFVIPYEGTTSEISNFGRYDTGSGKVGSPLGTYINPLTHWGTTLNDTHIVNMESLGNDGYFNTIDTPVNHYNVIETSNNPNSVVSYNWPPPLYNVDFTDRKYFSSPIIIDEGKGYTYKKQFGTGSDANGAPIDGRPVGRTAFIKVDDSGNITYPINHYKHLPTSKQELETVLYKGSLNGVLVDSVNDAGNIIKSQQGVGDFPNGLDIFPTSASYTIEVPDEYSEENEY
jgi:hypothetical protein